MTKPEQIPYKAALAAAKSMCLGWINWDDLSEEKKASILIDARNAIASAINAWPGGNEKHSLILLPLPQEKNDD